MKNANTKRARRLVGSLCLLLTGYAAPAGPKNAFNNNWDASPLAAISRVIAA